jgi:hypothetical protein
VVFHSRIFYAKTGGPAIDLRRHRAPSNADDELKHSFLARPARSDFIRLKHRGSTKILLFLFAALTIRRAVAKSIIRSCLIGSRVLQILITRNWQLAPRKNAKAPRIVFVGSSTMEMDR